MTGVDLTRGVAVLGMFTAHVGAAGTSWSDPAGWLRLADGRSAATFAVLAGVSLGLVSGGAVAQEGTDLSRTRVRLLVRCGLLAVLGVLLVALDTPVAVILPAYAVILALAVPLLRWRPVALLGLAAGVLVVGPPVVLAADRAAAAGTGWVREQPLELLVGGYYPAVVWIAYVLVGLAVARLDLRARWTPVWCVVAGTGLAAAGYLTGALGGALVPAGAARELLDVTPHADTAPEVTGNAGVALVLLGSLVLLGRWVADHRVARTALAPLEATGALALTAYCGHVVAIALLGDDVVRSATNAGLAAFVVVTLAATWAWRSALGRGPLERLVHEVSTRAAERVVPRPAPDPR